jgi:16S rRNA (guanine527-N7)-methyltransferase
VSLPEFRAALGPVAGVLPALTAEQEAALAAHIELLLRWNTRINLTSVRNFEEAVRKHAGESLFLASKLPAEACSACDLGSGGGFPGIPVAIVRSESRITLIERDLRKSVFLREASRQLPNVLVVTKQFEELSNEFDWLISRAVNLAATRTGPVPRHAAVLGGESLGQCAGLAGRYEWRKIPVPWEKGGFLWLGDVLRSEG